MLTRSARATILAVLGAGLALAAAPSPAWSAAGGYVFTPMGRVLGPDSIGQPAGEDTGTADASAVELPDGSVRVYFGLFDNTTSMGGQIGSATAADGVHFAQDPGLRIAREPMGPGVYRGASSPLITKTPAGFRLFFTGGGGVMSATSGDGLTFAVEDGFRLMDTAFGYGQFGPPSCTALIELASGYRMYCSQPISQTQVGSARLQTSAVFSAWSKDLVTWTPEGGLRLGDGSALPGDAQHPTVAAVGPGDAVTLVFNRRLSGGMQGSREMVASSSDGLAFGNEAWSGLFGTEPSFLTRADGSMLLYYGNHSPETGSIISVASVRQGAATVCTVPKLIGRTVAQARKAAIAAHCVLGRVSSVWSATVPKGQVATQAKKPGTVLAEGSRIAVGVSKGHRPGS